MQKYNTGDLVFVPESLNNIWTGFAHVRRTVEADGRFPAVALVTMLTGKMVKKEGGFDTDKLQRVYTSPITSETAQFGDLVRLTHKVKSYENGWENSWVENMDKAVGEIGTVTNSSTMDKNVDVKFPSVPSGYGYPDFALVRLTTEQPKQEGQLVVPVNTPVSPVSPVSPSLLKEARAIAVELAAKNRLVNADQVQTVLTEKGFGRLGNSAGSLFTGKNWKNTGTSVQSTQASARGRRVIVWEYTGIFPDAPVAAKVDVTTAVQVTADNIKVGTRVALGPGYKVLTDQKALGLACIVKSINRGNSFYPVTIVHEEGPNKGRGGICAYHELVLI